MTLALVLLEGTDVDVVLSPASAKRLAQLGVTRLDLLRDGQTVGVVLEGWAFDADRDAAAAVAVVAGDRRARTFLPVIRVDVGPGSTGGARSSS